MKILALPKLKKIRTEIPSVVEETTENYADEVDEDILEDSVDTTDTLEPTAPVCP